MRRIWRAFCSLLRGSSRAWSWYSSAWGRTDTRRRFFPAARRSTNSTAWVVPNYVEKLNAFRLTLTLPVLNAAAHVIFMVTGADKAATLREVLEGPPELFPAQRIRPARGRVSWFVDGGAAQLLSPAARG